MLNNNAKGVAYAVGYMLLTCASLMFVESISVKEQIDPLIMLWVNAIVATIIMHIILLSKLKLTYIKFIKYPLSTTFMMVTVLLIVASSFYSIKKIGTMEYLVLYFSVMGFVSSLVEILLHKNKLNTLRLMVFAIVCIMLVNHLMQKNDIAVVITFIGASAGVLYARFSQKLALNVNMSALQILSIRYWFVIVIIPLLFNDCLESVINGVHVLKEKFVIITLLSIITLILPLYMTQKSLKHISYSKNGIINSCAPLIAILGNYIFTNNLIDSIFIVAATCIFLNTLLTKHINSHKMSS